MPRRRDPNAARVVHRTARVGLRLTRAQRERCFGLLRSAGDVWACVLELNSWRYRRGDRPAAGYQQLCRLLAESGPGTFGELDSVGARSVLRRYSDAWFAAAKRRNAGDLQARYPRRRRGLLPVRWYHGTFTLDRRAAAATHRGRQPAVVAAPGPQRPVPGRHDPFGHPGVGRGPIVDRGHRGTTGRGISGRAGPRPGPGRRHRPRHHPHLRARRTRRARPVAVRPRGACRTADASGRYQGPPQSHRRAGTQTRPAQLAAVA